MNSIPSRVIFFWLLFNLFVFLAPTIQAQEGSNSAPDDPFIPSATLQPTIHFSHLTADDGLAQNTVEDILQDRQGFIWIGTLDGLSRFDGYTFTTYKHDPNNPNSLSHNWVRDIFEDHDGFIWIGTEGGGVNRFDPLTETFTRYLPDLKNHNSLAGDRVFGIFQESSGNFWFVGGGLTGLNRFDPVNQTFTRYETNPTKPNAFQDIAVSDVVEDKAGNLWLKGERKLARYNPSSDSFTYFEPPDPKELRLAVLHLDSAGNLWLGGLAGLYRFDVPTETFIHYPAPTGVSDLVEDSAGNFWLASRREGLYLFDPRSGQVLSHYQHDPTQIDSLSSNDITTLYQDRAGVLWVGSAETGLNVYDPRQARFAHYRHTPNTPATLASGPVDALHVVDNNRLWVATGGVLNLINFDTGQVEHFTPPEPERSINALYQDRSGLVWLGLNNLGLAYFEPATGQFTTYPLKSLTKRPTPPKAIVALHEDSSGNLWVAVNHDGLYRLDPARETVQFYEGPPSLSSLAQGAPFETAPRPPITHIFGDRAGYIWLSTLNGVSRFDPTTGSYQQHRAKAGESSADSYMETVFEDKNGLIWVASRDGLIRLDPATKAVKYYTEREGLPTAFVVGILEDKAGHLWLSTKKGLAKFDPDTETFHNYDASDGLQGNDFSLRAFAQAPDGRLFFGGPNGLTAFYPNQIEDNPYQPPVVLTGLRLFNQPVSIGQGSPLSQAIWRSDTLTFNSDQNILTFEFAALSYAAPRKNQYRYKLEGFENDWNQVDSTRRTATYTNLPAGDYVLRVQGSNNNGRWSNQEVALKLTILPPWWETAWFRLVGLTTLALILYGGYRWRIYGIQRQNRLLEMQVASRTRELTERTDDLAQSYALLEAEVSERKRAEQALLHAKALAEERSYAAEAANRAKSAFLANMSHELRSPLNAILGFAQVMSRSQSLPSEHQENLNIISRSGEHLLALINQVLDLSKIEAGRVTLNKKDFDLHRLLDDLENMFRLKAQSQGLQLLFERADDLPQFIHTDEVKLRQILINLLSNALKFTEKGSVTVQCKAEGGRMKDESFSFHLPPSSPAPERGVILHPFFYFRYRPRHCPRGDGDVV